MKILSLNVESKNHFTRTLPFIEQLNADVVCLQESTLDYEQFLKSNGYVTCFVPRCIKEHASQDYVDGLLIGSKYPATFETHFYHKPTDEIPREVFNPEEERYDNHQVCVLAHITTQTGEYCIGNNHFTWTPEGNKPGIAQRTDIEAFMKIARTPGPQCTL
jgi:exonuclease III